MRLRDGFRLAAGAVLFFACMLAGALVLAVVVAALLR